MNDAFRAGLDLFNSRAFYDCHDTWEDLWLDTTGPDRVFYQGMIQMAVGYYHATSGNYRGAASQLSKAVSKLTPYLPQHLGIPLHTLLPVVEAHRNEFEELPQDDDIPFDTERIPHIPTSE
jgi:hypothetical protein